MAVSRSRDKDQQLELIERCQPDGLGVGASELRTRVTFGFELGLEFGFALELGFGLEFGFGDSKIDHEAESVGKLACRWRHPRRTNNGCCRYQDTLCVLHYQPHLDGRHGRSGPRPL